MKRSAFKRPERAPVPKVPLLGRHHPKPRGPTAALRIDDGKARMVVPVPKREYVRSEALMKAYRRLECQHCGRDDGSVCGAHANWSEFGKGKSIKASDVFCASLCQRCHYQLDQGRLLSAAERRAMWQAAHIKTIAKLVELGYWPAGIEVPTIEETE